MVNLEKKLFRLGRHMNAATLRLALSYMSIIMVLSVSFSVVFYWTSTKELGSPVRTSASGTSNKTNKEPEQQLLIGGTGNDGKPEVVTDSAEDLHAQLQERVAGIRADLLQRLVTLNAAAFILSALLSLYLARRTLWPIEAAAEAQNRFASDASHELRTPLTIMQSEIEVVLNKQHVTLERTKRALQSNYQEVVRLRQLSEGLLQLARSSKPIPANRLTTIALDETVNDAINQVIKLAQTKRVAIRTAVPILHAKGNRQGVIQTLTILLDNAIKYSPKGGAIYIGGSSTRSHVCIAVRDEGAGIPAVDLPHIFDRFYRASPERSQPTGGYGLGLSIAKRLAEQYGGDITVESVPKKGSVFTLRLLKS